MVEVPYQRYPTAQPSAPGERISVNTPGAAFGENIGAALKGMGQEEQQAGGEIFQRATAIQELRNETEAREADSKYAEQQGMLHADYTSLEGKAAVDGLRPYIKQSHDLRQSIRDSLSNPAAQRFYDSSSLGFLQRNIFNAAGHAGNENKRWADGTLDAQADLTTRSSIDPGSTAELDDKQRRLEDISHQKAGLHSWTEDQRKDWVLQKSSKTIESQITAVGMEDINKAFQMVDRYKGSLGQDDLDRLKDRLLTMNRAQGSSYIADKVYKPGMSLTEAEASAKKLAEDPKYSHNDPLFADASVKAVRSKFVLADQAKRQEDHQNLVAIDDAIQTKNPKDMQDLMADPKTAAIIEALPADKREKIPAAINSYNAAKFKNANDTNFTKLWGQANGDADDRAAFMNTDITSQNISQTQMRSLMSKRAQMLKNPDIEDPRLHRAVSWLSDGKTGAWMNSIGLNKKTDPDNWFRFTGALEQAIDVWTQEKGKPPEYKDVKETIGPQLLKQQYKEPGMFGIYGGPFGSDQAVFQREPEAAFVDQVKSRAAAKGEPIPDDKEIFQAYMRQEFIKLYHKKSSDGGSTKSNP